MAVLNSTVVGNAKIGPVREEMGKSDHNGPLRHNIVTAVGRIAQ